MAINELRSLEEESSKEVIVGITLVRQSILTIAQHRTTHTDDYNPNNPEQVMIDDFMFTVGAISPRDKQEGLKFAQNLAGVLVLRDKYLVETEKADGTKVSRFASIVTKVYDSNLSAFVPVENPVQINVGELFRGGRPSIPREAKEHASHSRGRIGNIFKKRIKK